MTDIANSEAYLGAAAYDRRAAARARSWWRGRCSSPHFSPSGKALSPPASPTPPLFRRRPASRNPCGTLFKDGEVFPDLGTTLLEIVIAFALSVVFGVASAVVLDRNDWLNRILSPFLTAFNSMPRIALGPLFILWFGIGIASKVVLAFSLGYFIMLLSTLGGLKNVDRDLLLMSRLFGASELRLFRHVRLPWALPEHLCRPQAHLDLLQCRRGHR